MRRNCQKVVPLRLPFFSSYERL